MSAEKYAPFIDATKNTFKALFGIELKESGAYIRDGSEDEDWQISASLGLAGEDSGMVVLSMTRQLALYLIQRAIPEAGVSDNEEDIIDTFSEVVNTIAGNAKGQLKSQYKIELAIPVFHAGDALEINWPKKARAITAPFHSEGGVLYVSFALEKTLQGV
jgi:chemotaxis protein CheX